MAAELNVRWHRDKGDPRCGELVLEPINYLCQKWQIPMGEAIESATIQVFYRFILKHKPPKSREFWMALIDDLPAAYHPRHNKLYGRLMDYDGLICSNRRLVDHMVWRTSKRCPAIFFPGITGQEYYRDIGVLRERVYHDKPRMAFGFHGGYAFDVERFAHPGWTLLYFSDEPLHGERDDIIRMPFQSVLDYYRIVSEFSPDVLVQGWPEDETLAQFQSRHVGNAPYKANQKFRESITFQTCLLADDRDNIYDIQPGTNGFIWHDLDEFHALLEETPVETFRAIGRSHRHRDRELLEDLYAQIVRLAREQRR